MDATSTIVGFLLGTVGSLFASMGFDRWTRPRLTIKVDDAGRAQGENPGAPPHEFFHVIVRNERDEPHDDLVPGLRPAWSCAATLEVLSLDQASSAIAPVAARWTSQPEPILTLALGTTVVHFPDVARMIAGRRVDIHAHTEQQLSILLKFEGEDECYLFTNESYAFPRWANPAWRLATGRHLLRVTVYGEFGSRHEDFWIINGGPSREDVRVIARAAV